MAYTLESVYKDIRYDAKRRGHSFSLKQGEFRELVTRDCAYCGSPPVRYRNRNGCTPTKDRVKVNGIDRLDNSRGYSVDNTVPCCYLCNKMKSTLGVKDFLKHVKKVASWQRSTRPGWRKKSASTTKKSSKGTC